MKYVPPEPVKYHIELNLRSGRRVEMRVCDPHDASIPINDVYAQLGAMEMSDYLKSPDGKIISGVTVGGGYVMIPDFEIEYMHLKESPHPWNECHLDKEVFAPEDEDDDADIIQLKDIRLYDEED